VLDSYLLGAFSLFALHSASLQRFSEKLPLLHSCPGGVRFSERPVRTELRRAENGALKSIIASLTASTPT